MSVRILLIKYVIDIFIVSFFLGIYVWGSDAKRKRKIYRERERKRKRIANSWKWMGN